MNTYKIIHHPMIYRVLEFINDYGYYYQKNRKK